MALYGDERLHQGVTGLGTHKPDLVIVLRRSEPLWKTGDQAATEQEYLDSEIAYGSPLRKAYRSITLVVIPGITFALWEQERHT
jgi:hypothetical protein